MNSLLIPGCVLLLIAAAIAIAVRFRNKVCPTFSASRSFNPRQSVADLLTSRREAAFEDLRAWWKVSQPDDWFDYAIRIGRVDRYDAPAGRMITVVFSGERGQQKGGIHPVRDDGHYIKIYGGYNYIGDNSQFTDVNNDGVPEIVDDLDMAGMRADNPTQALTETAVLAIVSVHEENVALLQVLFDVREWAVKRTWRWILLDGKNGAKDVLIEQKRENRWVERARFIWSENTSSYQGPTGSIDEGFIAGPAYLDRGLIKAFVAPERLGL